jgi:hypothetical protein
MSNHINIKAQNALNKIQSILFSYLEADPKKVQNISTIIPSNRNDANGYANLKVTYIDYANIIQVKTIRLETNIFGDCIFLKPKKAVSLKNVDLIIFYDEKLDSFYLSDKTICNMKWLDDKSIRDIATDPYGKTFYSYKIDTLLEHHHILQLIKYDKVHIIHDSFLHYYQGVVLKGHTDTKKYIDYNPKKAKDFYILCDAKDRDTIFWCYHNETQADKAATLLGLAQANFSQKQIQGLNNSQLQDKLHEEKNINWNDCKTVEKRGSCVIHVFDEKINRSRWEIDEEIPIFTQDRNYIEKVLPVEEV